MLEDNFVIAIALFLPLTACMLLSQKNPYHALVIRGILGAIAALFYALLGAADVALTEALVGTMLSITLYAIAVRSSLCMRLGVLETDELGLSTHHSPTSVTETAIESVGSFDELLGILRKALSRHHMRVELVPYPTARALESALLSKEIHSTCMSNLATALPAPAKSEACQPQYHVKTRVPRLYNLIQPEVPQHLASLSCI
ncbi:putative subunit of the multisubunit Na+/H+ antiporter [Rubidibacter lacunae KORDI 51-2]|uniref:Putative subunit of the multisubunit Na+/H+ antiporter n=1 Tax=Rubidibacter lacunae KORDI 51-2 TaxID=582515 RepID=U5DE96_9CHRO|nr:DUF4040 domain-containing protein [Rubidibacter lacunae]ERN42838.1 putative subunit of the multisubunit Na+/H+ antiporter [Rubidibacter lacunae KORDI 51-2]